MNNRILLLLSNLNSQFGNTLLTTQHMVADGKESWKAGKPESLESLERLR